MYKIDVMDRMIKRQEQKIEKILKKENVILEDLKKQRLEMIKANERQFIDSK